jgi:SAM-dependent methyltransferase
VEDPVLRILVLLAVTVGLPYFLLSATGPLVQAWYARHYEGAPPYWLYALSNTGSMLALLSYPFLFEPFITTRAQAIGWSMGYALFAVLCGCAALASRTSVQPAGWAEAESKLKPEWRQYLWWLALPGCASLLLLSITTHLSQNVAAIPFLWILPLSLYLLSFILSFGKQRWYVRGIYVRFLSVALGGMAYTLSPEFENTSVKVLIPLFLAGLFLSCMVCHGELAQLKPHPRFLTTFYLMISLGGTLGGIFVGLIAPYLFRGYFELQIGLGLCGILAATLFAADFKPPRSLVPPALAAALAAFLIFQIVQTTSSVRWMARNFYGALRVMDTGKPGAGDAHRTLTHGTINHGQQFLHPMRKRQATTYYGEVSGIGRVMRALQRNGSIHAGLIGLGTGTLAFYGRKGDDFRFYEINPLVIRVAETEFTFLKECRAKWEVVLGDARLSLEREPAQNFDLLAVDAFSSDSIPVHLLTREAFQTYNRHLKPDGVLAVHVSNLYLKLEPVVRLAAETLGKEAKVVESREDQLNNLFEATWVLIPGQSQFFQAPEVYLAAGKIAEQRGSRLWTDDYSNLLRIMK